MKIAVDVRDDEGNLKLSGELSKKEVSFLLQYAINQLMAAGVVFNLTQEPSEDETRFSMPDGVTLQ